MKKDIVYGTDVQVFKDGTLVACGQSISVKGSRKEIAITCAGTGDIEQTRQGKAKMTFSINGMWQQTTGADVATNVTVKEMWDTFLSNDEVTIEFKAETPTAGDITYLGVGYFSSMGMDGAVDESGKMDVSGIFNSFDIAVTA